MKLLLAKLENIALTIITILLTLYPSYLLLLVRLGGYIVNLCDFYSYKPMIIEFSLSNLPVASSTSTARRSPSSFKDSDWQYSR